MRQSRISRLPWLSQAAITNISPIGFVAGEPVYPVCGAEGEGGTGSGKGGDNTESGESGSGSSNNDGDKGGDDDDKDDKPPKDPKQYEAWVKIRDLSRENANRRVKNKELDDKLQEAQKELEALKAKDMSDLEKANTQVTKLTKTNEEQTAKVEALLIENAFLKLPRDKYNWHNPGAALTLLMAEHRSDLTLNDDGTVDGMDKAVKELAKNNKFLLATAANSSGDKGGDGDGDKGGSTGGSYGANGDRGSGDARKAYQQKAASRFDLGV